MRVLVTLDGNVADPDQPQIRVDDLGLMRGDGIFETVLVVEGKPRELDLHLNRLARSASLLELPPPDRAGWEARVQQVIDRLVLADSPEMALKLVYTRGIDGGDGTPTGVRPRHGDRAEGAATSARDGVAAVIAGARLRRRARRARAVAAARRQVAVLRGQHGREPGSRPRAAPTRSSSARPTASCWRARPPT